MIDQKDVSHWVEKAEQIFDAMTDDDRVENILCLSMALRQAYFRGRQDGVHDLRNALRE